jgi:hypothetical protein
LFKGKKRYTAHLCEILRGGGHVRFAPTEAGIVLEIIVLVGGPAPQPVGGQARPPPAQVGGGCPAPRIAGMRRPHDSGGAFPRSILGAHCPVDTSLWLGIHLREISKEDVVL